MIGQLHVEIYSSVLPYCRIEDVRFQEGETCDAMWASTDKIREMMASGEFLSEWFYPYFEEMVEKWGVIVC
ncbi:MAG TPA: hypothetical protein PK733_18430 [Clostridiales bacterium]|nr:hypothetical protein [Clostridiales bacterium]